VDWSKSRGATDGNSHFDGVEDGATMSISQFCWPNYPSCELKTNNSEFHIPLEYCCTELCTCFQVRYMGQRQP